MGKCIDSRIVALESYVSSIQTNMTVFIIEGGGEFHTDKDAFAYLLEHGAYTPDGRRLVRYPHPVDDVDDLSLSFYQMLDEAVEKGCLVLPDLESDAVGG